MGGIAIVDGSPGAGKTTLIERLLESNKSRSIRVSRCLARPGSGQWNEEHAALSGKKPSRHKELRRWLDAGADGASVLTYDPRKFDIDCLLSEVDGGIGGWDEWVLEAENVEYSGAHCSVYVLRPLPETAQLFEDKERIVSHMSLDEYLRYSGDEPSPDEPAEPGEDALEEVEFNLPFDEELPENLAKAGVALTEPEKNRLRTLIREGVPVWSKRPELRPECARLPAAEVVVVNLHCEQERVRAEATCAQVVALFRNWNIRYQLDFRSRVTRPGVYVANLQDAHDAGTQKALAQIKRKLRGCSTSGPASYAGRTSA